MGKVKIIKQTTKDKVIDLENKKGRNDINKKKKSKSDKKVNGKQGEPRIDIKDGQHQEFVNIKIRNYISLSPCYANDLLQGLNDFLNTFILKYLNQVDGIVLAHSDTKMLDKKGKINYDSPFINFWFTTKFLVWRPLPGSKLVGTITMQSADHIGLILHNTFNASIPASEIPNDKYRWVASMGEYSIGEWVSVDTNEPISKQKNISFTVKELQSNNDMLTVHGSLLDSNE